MPIFPSKDTAPRLLVGHRATALVVVVEDADAVAGGEVGIVLAQHLAGEVELDIGPGRIENEQSVDIAQGNQDVPGTERIRAPACSGRLRRHWDAWCRLLRVLRRSCAAGRPAVFLEELDQRAFEEDLALRRKLLDRHVPHDRRRRSASSRRAPAMHAASPHPSIAALGDEYRVMSVSSEFQRTFPHGSRRTVLRWSKLKIRSPSGAIAAP